MAHLRAARRGQRRRAQDPSTAAIRSPPISLSLSPSRISLPARLCRLSSSVRQWLLLDDGHHYRVPLAGAHPPRWPPGDIDSHQRPSQGQSHLLVVVVERQHRQRRVVGSRRPAQGWTAHCQLRPDLGVWRTPHRRERDAAWGRLRQARSARGAFLPCLSGQRPLRLRIYTPSDPCACAHTSIAAAPRPRRPPAPRPLLRALHPRVVLRPRPGSVKQA